MRRIRAFILGIIEFRDTITTGFDSGIEYDWYESGRDFAHRVTFQKWDEWR